MKIDKPGIYMGVADADYRADPCPSPSLTQSLCKILLERSPQHAFIASSSLNPMFEPDSDPKFDLGNVAHQMLLGRGKDIEVLDFPDWRTKAAKEAREAAVSEGRVAVLTEQFKRAADMVEAARKQIARHRDDDAFTDGDAEAMLCWHEDGIWFRSLIDWLHDDRLTIDDFKSTGMSVAPHVIGLRAQAAGWEIQAAFIERGLDVIDPGNAGRRKFRFIAQETDPPHALTIMHMDEHWLTMGRKKVDTAVKMWKNAIQTGFWPGYPTVGIVPEYPGFKESQWLDRELSGEFDPDPKLIMAG